MPVVTLTNKTIKDSTCPAGKHKVDLHDAACKGLMVEIRASGGGTYYLRYRNERNKVRQLRLGDIQDLSLDQARKKADAMRARVAMGDDPCDEKASKRATPTIRDFIMNSYMPFVKVNKRSWSTDWSLLKNHVLPRFGDKYMDELTKHDVIGFIGQHSVTHKPGSVNRVVIILRYLFNLALRWDTAGVKTNPTEDIPLLEENNKKERYLSEHEAQALFLAVQDSENPLLQHIISMLLLTGARKREVMNARWGDFDFERRLWRIEVNKSGKTRHVPMSDGVVIILQSVPKIKGCEFVFANPDTLEPFNNVYCSWNTARKKAGLSDVRIHDLRHSFASFLVNSGRSLYEVQKILGHTQIKTTQRYAHLANDTLLDAANLVSRMVPLGQAMPVAVNDVPMVSVKAA